MSTITVSLRDPRVAAEGGRWYVSVPWDQAENAHCQLREAGFPSTICLDVARRQARLELGAGVDPQKALAALRGAPGLRVLVADDNRDSADTLGVLLVHHGHQCRVAYDGGAAVQAALEFRPHVALLDLLMPHDGFAAARQLRHLGPVVLVALTGEPDFEKRCGASGFRYFLRKPADPEEVIRILGAVRAGLGCAAD